VSYHESFWIAIAAAAPVIALAAVVSVADLFRAAERISRTLPHDWADKDFWTNKDATSDWPAIIRRTNGAYRLLRGGYAAALINGGLQLVALSMALQSLADGNDVVPTLFPDVAVPLGIFLLLVSTTINALLQIVQRWLDQLLHPDGRAGERGGPPLGESQEKHD
jgi:hypothetical protein